VREFVASGGTAIAIDPLAIQTPEASARTILEWCDGALAKGIPLVYSTADSQGVKSAQDRLGVEKAGALVEEVLAKVAVGLVQRGVRRLVVAGGETSGAVVQALGVTQLRIGPQIDPGVPWCAAHASAAGATMHLALKSGNFGAPDFFARAFALLAATKVEEARLARG